ncbi:MAG: hypothetical protein MJ139_05670, partial [Limosilactobacillus sp.]|nr:hypothetical protein [Limosilactobacillus sp.]
DKDGNELGKVMITGMAGQTYTIPATQKFDGNSSTLVDQKDLQTNGDQITAKLSDFKLGDKLTLPQAGITYEAVPGNMEDYYDVVPQVKKLGYYDLPYVDESTSQLKDPSQVKTDGYGHGLVKVTVVGYDKPAYIPMDEKYYRYFGNVKGFNTSLNKSTDYSYKNIYTGGTPAAIFEFKDIVSVASQTDPTATGVEVPLNTTAADLTKQVLANVTVPNLPAGASVTNKQVTSALPATDTPGEKTPVTVEVTYNDGTKDTVSVPVTVLDKQLTNAEAHEPKLVGDGVSVPQHSTKLTEDDIIAEVDVPNMPAGTTMKVADPTTIPSTDEVVTNKPVTVVVSYPDNTTDKIDVPVTVTPVTVKGGELTVRQGDPAITAEQIETLVTLTDAPAGTTKQVTGQIPTTAKPATKVPVEVTVTYPNGTTEKTTVLVTVTPNDAETHTPTTDGVTVPEGTSLTGDDITKTVKIPDMPAGTKVEVKDPATIPATDTPGDEGTVTVFVTYPDTSKDEIDVPVKVTPLSDADKHTPTGQDITTDLNTTPKAEDSITNKD